MFVSHPHISVLIVYNCTCLENVYYCIKNTPNNAKQLIRCARHRIVFLLPPTFHASISSILRISLYRARRAITEAGQHPAP